MRPSALLATSLVAAVVVIGLPTAADALTVAPRDTDVSVAGCPSATAHVGSSYLELLNASDPRAVFSLKGDLPPGLSLNTESGAISGVPTDTGVWSVSVVATVGGIEGEYGPCGIEVTVSHDPPRITTKLATDCPIDDAVVGRAYRFQMAAIGPGGIQYGASGLPKGLSVDAGTGLISGTPTELGTSSTRVSVTSLDGTAARSGCAMTVRPPRAPSFLGCPPDAVAGQAYREVVGVRSGAPVELSSSWLPAGLSLDSATGVLAGTPTTPGRTSVVFSAADDWGGYARMSCDLTVRAG